MTTEQVAPDQTTPEETPTSRDDAPEAKGTGPKAPGRPAPTQTAPSQTAPGETAPGRTPSGQTPSSQTQAGPATSGAATPGQGAAPSVTSAVTTDPTPVTAPVTAPAPLADPPYASGLSATLCRDPAQFAALGEEWDDLRRRCRPATAFQSHAWLYSWWLSYGKEGRLRVVLVREGDGRLVAAAPLMLTHRPLPVLVPMGVGLSDFLDVLLDDEHPRAAAALARALRRAAAGAVIDLREVRPGAAAERLYDAWRGPRRRLEDSACLELPGVPMESLLERLAIGSARHTRRKLRKIDSLGVEERVVAPEDVPQAVTTMLRLHQLQWRDRGVTPEHLRPRFAAHLERSMGRMVQGGDAEMTEYHLGGAVVACDITLASQGLVCGYLYGAHPDLRAEHIDIATMLLRHNARYAAETGRSTLSLLRGTEPYKLRWQPETLVNQRLLLARHELAPALALHAAAIAGRELAAGVVRERVDLVRTLRTWRPGWGGVKNVLSGPEQAAGDGPEKGPDAGAEARTKGPAKSGNGGPAKSGNGGPAKSGNEGSGKGPGR
jgi:hypothetical protein